MANCIRMNNIAYLPDVSGKKRILFKNNELLEYEDKQTVTEDCSCPGSVPTEVTYYLVVLDGSTFRIRHDLCREVACDGPPEEVTGRQEDEAMKYQIPDDPDFKDIRRDNAYMKAFKVVFDMRHHG